MSFGVYIDEQRMTKFEICLPTRSLFALALAISPASVLVLIALLLHIDLIADSGSRVVSSLIDHRTHHTSTA